MKLTYKHIAAACAALAGVASVAPAAAQSNSVYRCGNEYTNDIRRVERGGCTPLTGGNVTIVRGTTVRTSNTSRMTPRATQPQRIPLTAPSAAPATRPSISNDAQRARDQGARGILQMELDKASKRLTDLQKEYNNGNPENRPRAPQSPEVSGSRCQPEIRHRPHGKRYPRHPPRIGPFRRLSSLSITQHLCATPRALAKGLRSFFFGAATLAQSLVNAFGLDTTTTQRPQSTQSHFQLC